ncbi:MAG: hypothetical protein WBA87_14090 [Microbacterium sp.]
MSQLSQICANYLDAAQLCAASHIVAPPHLEVGTSQEVALMSAAAAAAAAMVWHRAARASLCIEDQMEFLDTTETLAVRR